MQLIEDVHEVDLIRQLNLTLNHVAEFIIKLFCEVGVTLAVNDVGDATIRHELSP